MSYTSPIVAIRAVNDCKFTRSAIRLIAKGRFSALETLDHLTIALSAVAKSEPSKVCGPLPGIAAQDPARHSHPSQVEIIDIRR